jgi:hypothetical protein
VSRKENADWLVVDERVKSSTTERPAERTSAPPPRGCSSAGRAPG